MTAAQDMLVANMLACAQRIDKLRLSVEKTKSLFPLTLERATTLTEDEEESVDALMRVRPVRLANHVRRCRRQA